MDHDNDFDPRRYAEDFLQLESTAEGKTIYKVQGSWDGKTAGGCFNNATWRWNQQIFVKAEETKHAKIKLIQHTKGEPFYIGFYLMKTDGSGKRQIKRDMSDIECKAGFKQAKEIFTELELKGGQEYILIPCTFNPGECAKYTVAFTISGDLNLHLLSPQDEWVTVEADGEWFEATAGGCRNHPSFKNNPQFLLTAEKDIAAMILLYRERENADAEDDFDTIGLYVIKMKGKDPTKRLVQVTQADVISKSEFENGIEANLEIELEAGQYMLVGSTFDPGAHSTFVLTVLADGPCKLSEVDPKSRHLKRPKPKSIKPPKGDAMAGDSSKTEEEEEKPKIVKMEIPEKKEAANPSLSAAEYQEMRMQTRKAGLFNFIQAMGGHIDMKALEDLKENHGSGPEKSPRATPRAEDSSRDSSPRSARSRDSSERKEKKEKKEGKEKKHKHKSPSTTPTATPGVSSESLISSPLAPSTSKEAPAIPPKPPKPNKLAARTQSSDTLTVPGASPPASSISNSDKPKRDKKEKKSDKTSSVSSSPAPERALNRSLEKLPEVKISNEVTVKLPDNVSSEAVKLFNEKPKKGIEYLVSNKHVPQDAAAISGFLFQSKGMDRNKLGEYLGEGDAFNVAVLHAFCAHLDFTDIDFDVAMRQLLSRFRLPGEAQKIDRIMNSFAAQYYTCNKSQNMFKGAAIMLHTDAHSANVKKKMTKQEWLKNNRGLNAGKDLPEDFLLDLYQRITTDEMKMLKEGEDKLSSSCVKRGWLQMKTTFWVRRYWFILTPDRLVWYKNIGFLSYGFSPILQDPESSEEGQLPLHFVVVLKDQSRPLLFHMHHRDRRTNPAPIYSLLAPTEREFKSWLTLFRNIQGRLEKEHSLPPIAK